MLKPWLEGKDLKRWRAEPRDIYVIFARRGVEIENYPAVLRYLEQFRERLEPKAKGWQPTAQMKEWPGRKPGSYKWYELQDSIDYFKEFEKPKIIYNRFLSEPRFYLDNSGGLINDAPYFIPTDRYELLGLLNSNLFWYTIASRATALSGGYFQLHAQYVETFFVPEIDEIAIRQLTSSTKNCQMIASTRIGVQLSLTRRIPDLCPAEREAKLSTKLQDWWQMPNFAAFRAEVKKCFKADIPLGERNAWEDLFTTGKAEITKLSAEIKRNEDEINAIVYKLFDLAPDEIKLLETSIGLM